MKVRIGVALGGRALADLGRYGEVIDALDDLRFDSVWIPETFLAGTLDPIVALSFAAARVERLKLGTHLVTPGRNPFALAKALAQLDRLSNGRLLLTFVAGINDPNERKAQGMPTGDRTTWFDAHLPRMRAWWAGEEVDGLTLDTTPTQQPLEVWLGGQAVSALDRAARLADGWLPGAITIAEAKHSRNTIDRLCADLGREQLSREHFGINLVYALDEARSTPPALTMRPRGVGDATEVTAVGADALRTLVERWVDAGFTKIVVRPIAPPDDWAAELRELADAVVGLQT